MASLRERAMLVHFSKSMWTGAKVDSVVSDELCREKGAERGSGRWWTYFVPKKNLHELEKAGNAAKAIWQKYTLPWMDSIGIMLSENYMEFRTDMRQAMAYYDEAKERFLSIYPEIAKHAEASKRLGHLLDGKRMPTVEEVRDKFGIRIEVIPLPDTKDWRVVGLDDEEREKVVKEMEEAFAERTKKAMIPLWDKMTKLVEKIETTLSDPSKAVKDSLIGNLIDFCLELPKLNLVEDKNLEILRKEMISKLCTLGHNMDELRKDKGSRQEAAKKAKDVLEKIKGYAL